MGKDELVAPEDQGVAPLQAADAEPWPQPEVVVRPNGKPYKARKVRVHRWDNEGYPNDQYGVLVLGTQNMETAQSLANDFVRYWFDHDMIATRPEVDWFRLGFNNGERVWVRDAARGAAGVMFDADYPEDPAHPPTSEASR